MQWIWPKNNKLSISLFVLSFVSLTMLGCEQSSPEKEVQPELSTKGTSLSKAKIKPQSSLGAKAFLPYFADLEEIRRRRVLRVLVSPSQTNFFIRAGEFVGFEASLIKEYEKYINQKIPDTADHIHVLFIQKPFAELLSALEDGFGDIAAAGITVTEPRRERVSFSSPYLTGIREVVVVHKSVEDIVKEDDLSGRIVAVRAGTSYITHLNRLNKQFQEKHLQEMQLVIAEPRLRTEDLLELTSAGVVKITVADEHIARLWAEVLPNIEVLDLPIASGGDIAWALPLNNVSLGNHLSGFMDHVKKGSLLGNIYFKRYYENTYWIDNPVEPEFRKKFEQVAAIVRPYAKQYGFDWLKIMALAFQESRLDNEMRSPQGAVGVMQILPSTATETGISNIDELDNNIHAGIHYLSLLRDKYFSDSPEDPIARNDFVFASYNAGPTRISRLRREAENRGLDPDKWFSNVEQLVSEEIGEETVNYVANINKYYFSYQQERISRTAMAEKTTF